MTVDRAPRGRGPRFFLVDVFAREPLAGNPLAVAPDAEGLGEALMWRIACEFNQSETTFVLPPARAPARAGATWRLRPFTPAGEEVFGAGHNALGAWWWPSPDPECAEVRVLLDPPHGGVRLEVAFLTPPPVLGLWSRPCTPSAIQRLRAR